MHAAPHGLANLSGTPGTAGTSGVLCSFTTAWMRSFLSQRAARPTSSPPALVTRIGMCGVAAVLVGLSDTPDLRCL